MIDMGYTSLFKVLCLSIFSIGIIGGVTPYLIKNLKCQIACMCTICACYVSSVICMDMLYLANSNNISFTLIDLGRFHIAFHIEHIGLIFLNSSAILWFCTVIYTYGYFITLNSDHRLFQSMISVCNMISAMMIISSNLFTQFIFYEILTLCTVPLIYVSNKRIVPRYLVTLIVPSTLILLPVMIYDSFGSNHGEYMGILLFCYIFGFSKVAIAPLHQWIVNAMIAPHPVSALLHGATIVNSGIFALAKIIWYHFSFSVQYSVLLILAPFCSMIYSGIMAVRSSDIKIILAYSTISQLAISVIAMLMMSKDAIISSIIFIVAHAFGKITLFFAAGDLYIHTKSPMLCNLKGSAYKCPISALMFILGSASIIGAPAIAGGIGKSFIFAAASDHYIVQMILICSSLISFVSLGRVICYLYTIQQFNMQNISKVIYQSFAHFKMQLALVNIGSSLIVVTFCICALMILSFSSYVTFLTLFISRAV